MSDVPVRRKVPVYRWAATGLVVLALIVGAAMHSHHRATVAAPPVAPVTVVAPAVSTPTPPPVTIAPVPVKSKPKAKQPVAPKKQPRAK